MSLEELKSEEKKLTSAVGALIGLVIVLVIACVFITYQQGFTVFALLPLLFLPFVLVVATNLQKIKTEISARKG